MQPSDPIALKERTINFVAITAALFFLIFGLVHQEYSWTADGYDEPINTKGLRFTGVRVDATSSCVTLVRPSNNSSPTNTTVGKAPLSVAATCYKHCPGEFQHPTSARDVRTDQWVQLPELCGNDHKAIAESLGIPDKIKIEELWGKICHRKTTALWGPGVFSIVLTGLLMGLVMLLPLGDSAESLATCAKWRLACAVVVVSMMWGTWALADARIGVDTFRFESSRRWLVVASAICSGSLVFSSFILASLCRHYRLTSKPRKGQGFQGWCSPA